MSDMTWIDVDPYYLQDGLIAPASPAESSSSIFEEDEWEDGDFVEKINSKFPGWYLVKMIGFNWSSFGPVEDWCEENTKLGKWQKVGWESGCSYSVGVVFESARDAMMFKLRWR